MKRSFYDILAISHDAKQQDIDTAYESVTAKLNAVNLRGTAETVMQAQLVKDGYQILSDPVKRAYYDAKLAASESGVQLMFFPEGDTARHKLGVQAIVFAALATVLGGVLYYQLSDKMDEVRVEHVQAVIKQQEEQNKVRVIRVDTSRPASIANSPAEQQKR